jgi:NAD(P)-dependent dehydrogenase (short-subunit alcohol dehydrogenase family)
MSIINAYLPALRRSRGRIVQIIDAMSSAPVPFRGLAAASNAGLEALLSAYRADLKPFGVDITKAWMGRIQTSDAPATSDALISAAKNMSAQQHELYGRRLAAYAKRVGDPAADALDVREAAAHLIAILDRDPAPSWVAVGADAEAVLKAIQHLSDDQLDDMRLEPADTK